MKSKVIVIGHSYTSRLSVIRSVALLGCEITVIVMADYLRDGKTLNTRKPIDCYSKYVSEVFYCKRNDSNGLLKILMEKCIEENSKPILFADTDHTVATIDQHQEILSQYFIFPHIHHKQGAIVEWMDKVRQKEQAQKVGLKVAQGRVIDVIDGQYIVPQDMRYPCYSKPLSTFIAGKGGMRRCDNEGDLKSSVDFVVHHRNSNAKILVEEYMPIETEYATLGFSDGYNVLIPGVLQIYKMSKLTKGIAIQGKVMPVAGFEELVEKFKQLVLEIGYVGVFDIDFYRSKGQYYFCELNLRFGGSGYAFTKMGVNLPAMQVQYLEGQSVKGMQNKIVGERIYVNEKLCKDDYCSGKISFNEYRRYLNAAGIRFLPDKQDAAPLKVYKRELLKDGIKRNILKLFGRL